MYDIVVLTDERFVNPSEPTSDYVSNVLLEDSLIAENLEKVGLKTVRVAWSDPHFDWSNVRFVLFRTTWDYAQRYDEFKKWLDETSSQTTFINSYEQICWNLDKQYLRDLSSRGVHIVETLFIDSGDIRTLEQLHTETGWSHTVLKPAVSAGGKDTYKLDLTTLNAHEAKYKELIKKESMLLQPFQTNIVEHGEVSIVVINGECTHAVLKKAKIGDFRVQDDFGGTVQSYVPLPEEIALATKAVKACDPLPYYARVDLITDNNGKPAVSEIELIEPELWFRNHSDTAEILANSIKSRLKPEVI